MSVNVYNNIYHVFPILITFSFNQIDCFYSHFLFKENINQQKTKTNLIFYKFEFKILDRVIFEMCAVKHNT